MSVSFFTRVRHVLIDEPCGVMDLQAAGTLLAFGLWLLHPGWLLHRFPHIQEELTEVVPQWIWAAWFIVTSICLAVFSIYRRFGLMSVCYICLISNWTMIGWFFCVAISEAAPIGVIAPVQGVCALIRCLQIPASARVNAAALKEMHG